MKTTAFETTKITILQGDITTQVADAIVNAANHRLAGGGGVDGAIHRAGGPAIMEECDRIRQSQGGCPTGQAVLTTAGNLAARHVIHTVGPIWDRQPPTASDRLLADAYRNSLALAREHRLGTVAFPSISTGVYGFPIDRAARLVLRTVRDFVVHSPFEEIRFVLFSPHDLEVYEAALDELGE